MHGSVRASPNAKHGSDNRASSLLSPHRNALPEGNEERRCSIGVEIVSRAVRRFGRRVDILGSRVQFGNLFLAGSPDHRMPDEGGGYVRSLDGLCPSATPTISESIKLSRRPSVRLNR